MAILATLIAAGLAAGIIVFTQGLVVTNLTDLVPWGLWITIDLSAIALSAGAFTLCAAVYLIGLKEFQPVARTATFIGFIGYSMAMLCLLLDIGRPDRFWHGFVFWNTHSVLWEVTMCVGLYFLVLTMEILPIIGRADWLQERLPRIANLLSKVHHLAPYLAIAGLFLSMLHQSSLGATYGVLEARPIWYSPSLSVLFMFSAIVGGISLTVFASMIAAQLSSRANINDEILEKLAHFVGWGLVLYLYVRFWYTFSITYTYEPGRTEGLSLLTTGPLAVNFWVGEILIGMLIPMIILLKAKWRKNPALRMLALAMVVAGLVAYRWDVNLSGLLILVSYVPQRFRMLYTSYSPSLIEVLAGGGIVAYGLMAFSLGVRYLKVVDHGVELEEVPSRKLQPAPAAGD
jgi:Ni/Fe-hydrogenase subunit HybB-like protein